MINLVDFEIQFLPFGGFSVIEDKNNNDESGDQDSQGESGENLQSETGDGDITNLASDEQSSNNEESSTDSQTSNEENSSDDVSSSEAIVAEVSLLEFEVPEITWDLTEYQKKSNQLQKGGGKQIDVVKGKVDPRIREVVEKLATGQSQRQIKGNKEIDCVQFVKNSIKFNYSLPKYDYKPKKVYLFIDTSSSVSYLANMIITVILSCKQSRNIRVISGSEALPDKDEQSGMTYDFKYNRQLDVALNNFIKIEQPSLGSQFIFWGDIQMRNHQAIRPTKLKEILFPYKPLWLCSEKIRNDKDCNNLKTVMKIKENVNDVNKFINNLKI